MDFEKQGLSAKEADFACEHYKFHLSYIPGKLSGAKLVVCSKSARAFQRLDEPGTSLTKVRLKPSLLPTSGGWRHRPATFKVKCGDAETRLKIAV